MLGNIDDWIIVIVVALILFGGASKIPELFRNLGRAMGNSGGVRLRCKGK